MPGIICIICPIIGAQLDAIAHDMNSDGIAVSTTSRISNTVSIFAQTGHGSARGRAERSSGIRFSRFGRGGGDAPTGRSG